MEPSDAKSIAESLIVGHAKDIEYLTIGEVISYNDWAQGLTREEYDELISDVDALIDNATITVEFTEVW